MDLRTSRRGRIVEHLDYRLGWLHVMNRYRIRREAGDKPIEAMRKVADLTTPHPAALGYRCGEYEKSREYVVRIAERVKDGPDLVSAYWYWGCTQEVRVRAAEARGGVLQSW